jgi:hypothetical protein
LEAPIEEEVEKNRSRLREILNGSDTWSDPYLLIRNIEELNEMSKNSCLFIKSLRSKSDSFIIYIARDAAPIGEMDHYLTTIERSSKKSGIVYHG